MASLWVSDFRHCLAGAAHRQNLGPLQGPCKDAGFGLQQPAKSEGSMRRFTSLVCCTALALMMGVAEAGVMNPIPSDPITIESGRLSGTLLESGVRAYLGVPFAAPPVREL